jgi:hypothetical protein
VNEPEVALAFTADPWVEALHRHLADHGGARVRCVLVERDVALEEQYDVLVVGHRWPALTRALVSELRARSRAVLGVFDRDEPASRAHLSEIGVDAVVASDVGSAAIVRALATIAGPRPLIAATVAPPERQARLVVVGGTPGTGRTEVAIQLARASGAALVDADDVAPAVAQRLGLAIEPNLRGAIDAVEHGDGDIEPFLTRVDAMRVLPGMPNARAWSQVHPGEVVRVIDRVAAQPGIVIADGAGDLETIGVSARHRNAVARALIAEADDIVVVGDAAPHGFAKLLAWIVDARAIRADLTPIVVLNRAPDARYQRSELYREVCESVQPHAVVFCSHDSRVARAAWAGTFVTKGPFVGALGAVAECVA